MNSKKVIELVNHAEKAYMEKWGYVWDTTSQIV